MGASKARGSSKAAGQSRGSISLLKGAFIHLVYGMSTFKVSVLLEENSFASQLSMKICSASSKELKA